MSNEPTPRPESVTEEHLTYLDKLRKSGATNMFGAGAYLVRRFGVDRKESHIILAYWMSSFEERHPHE